MLCSPELSSSIESSAPLLRLIVMVTSSESKVTRGFLACRWISPLINLTTFRVFLGDDLMVHNGLHHTRTGG